MGIISRIFGRGNLKSSNLAISFDNDLICIDNYEFYGPYSKSKNGEYIIATMEGNWVSSGVGKLWLIFRNEIILKTNL